MTAASSPSVVSRSYWATSRSHRYSLLFALPLLVIYEVLEAVAPIRSGSGVIRNGADVILAGLATWIFGPRGPMIFMAIVIGVSLFLIWRDRKNGPIRLSIFGLMLGEAVLLALGFGFVVGVLTLQLLHSLSVPAGADSPVARLTLSVGAGLYEELLFRVILVAAIANGLRFLGFGRLLGGAIAVVVGALIFSAFHYIGPLGEPFRVESFTFRAIAGLAFSALYLTRGFGITAWTHALYDIGVMM
jgi:hypothetical protein